MTVTFATNMLQFENHSGPTFLSQDYLTTELNEYYHDYISFSMFRHNNVSLSDLMFDPRDRVLAHYRIWPCFFWITFIVGMVGNWFVIYVICRKRHMKTVTNMYLLNLAIVDILYLMATIPNTSFWSNYWPFGEFMCKFISYLMNVAMTEGVLTLTAIGLDRHYALLYPISSRNRRTLKRTVIVILSIWIFSFAVSSPSLFIARKIILLGTDVCLYHWPEAWSHKTYACAMFAFLYAIPQLVLILCYFRIGYKLWYAIRLGGQSEGATLRKLRTGRRVLKMVVIVTVAFAICWLPIHVMELYMAYGRDFSNTFYDLKLLAPLVPHLCIAANPFIYNFMSRTFHTHFKEACLCCTYPTKTAPMNEQDTHGHESVKLQSIKETGDKTTENEQAPESATTTN